MKNAMKHILSITVTLSVFLGFAQRLEASPSDLFLNRLQGTWQGDGQAFGMSARLQMKWEWVLGKKFLRLSLKTETPNATSGEVRAFEGHAYYRLAGEGKCEGGWFDSRGESFPLKSNIDADAMTALWGSPEKEEGKSVYRLLEANRLEVVDSVKQKDGKWKEFGRFVVIRQ